MTERERLRELIYAWEFEESKVSIADCDTDKSFERLVDKLLANGVIVLDTDHVDVVTNREPLRTAFGMPLDELAELIRAKQEGRLIAPPCKVGDTVYCIFGNNIIECKVARITIEHIEVIGMSFLCYGGMGFDMRHWGKTVFLSREEAEKALAERSKT